MFWAVAVGYKLLYIYIYIFFIFDFDHIDMVNIRYHNFIFYKSP